MSRSIASWPMPPGALRAESRRSDRSAIDCSRLSAMAAKCFSSPAISVGCALGVRWSGRSNALVVRGFTSSAPIEQQRCGGRRPECPQPHGESPPSVRRPARSIRRQQHAHVVTPMLLGSGLGRRFCGATRVLPQAPRCAIRWEWKGVGTLLPLDCPPWTRNLLAKRRPAGGGAVGPGGSPMGQRMQPRNEKIFTLFSKGRLECRREGRHSHGVPRRTARALGGARHSHARHRARRRRHH
jgi:hypothetical protein